MIDISNFCFNFRIDVERSRKGWVHLNCPFCGDRTHHLGYNLGKGYFFCLRCGWHPEELTVEALTGTDKKQARKLLLQYRYDQLATGRISPEKSQPPNQLEWPQGCGPMAARHKRYLFGRGFDPDSLEREWGLMGTGNWGPYSFRIIAPIIFRGEKVSWQGRDITDKQQAKYLPCPKEREILPHKHVLYGLDKARWKTAVVVEGITGVWRLGPGAVATFGVGFTDSQLLLLAQTFDRIMVLYDGDYAGQNAAEKMATELTGIGKEAEILEPIECDSGSIPDEMAEKIMKEIRR